MFKGILALVVGGLSAMLIGIVGGVAVGLLIVLAPLALIRQCLPRRAPKRG